MVEAPLYVNIIMGVFNQFITFYVHELHVEEFFVSFGIIFQIIDPEHKMLSLNIY